MSHTKQKKSKHANKTIRTKRKIIEDDDGWAHVIGGRTIQSGKTKTVKTKQGFDIVTYTIEEAVAKYKLLKDKWEDSNAHRELTDLLTPYKDNNQIKNVVVIGLGSIQTLTGDFKQTSQTQLAALTTIITALGLSDVPIIAQDPAFSTLDNEFLQMNGIEVLQDPKGFDLIDSYTLVYAIHCYPAIYEQVWKRGPPAVLIGNDLKDKDRSAGSIVAVQYPDIDTWYENLDRLFAMPQFRNDFSDTVWYCSKNFTLD